MLFERLKKENIEVEVVDFPQYGNGSSFFVEKYLRGEYGTLNDVNSYTTSLFYALDRYDKSFEIKKWLDKGVTVIANRYVSANMGHQASKIESPKERDKYLEWLDNLEFNMLAIPKPDQVIFLFVPPELGQKLVEQKGERKYTQGKKKDIHEESIEHLRRASEAYFYVAKKYNWLIVNCTENGEMLPAEVINDTIYNSIVHQSSTRS
jgi:dTMP kinase